ncbi:hypothetical protein ASPWEDRAFT_45703 [Aspergillus wentii DTO 134E9]|uniref:Uncharacterized protein n=1 Tax=Aspergillus wentii DTO 134E9 TaxID=1073089 RepID=A0A1L9R5I0_ASPWE|nr:uncharacterized protein ASPWEDRAFT_45703 [Aspergillus wentii DTO 134E9]KAI9923769.1 hypothetical protein MW887_008397 [Aspergillus wentii]OJJ30128.1 hypothetical protein ASPWEDRAFT_45703 [Aspergillus wentii DTO 134E9]
MHFMSASVRFASVEDWEDFSKDNDEKALEQMFTGKGATIQKPINSTHGMPPIHNMTLEAPDDMEAEDLQRSKFPEGVLVHIEEDI